MWGPIGLCPTSCYIQNKIWVLTGFEVGRCGSFLSGLLYGFLVGFRENPPGSHWASPVGLAQLGPTKIGVSSLGGAQLGSHHEPSWGPVRAHMGMLAGYILCHASLTSDLLYILHLLIAILIQTIVFSASAR
jgi:hypothetical protein